MADEQVAGPVFTFAGETFAVRETGIWPIMQFAHVANQGIDSGSMEGLDAIYQLLEAVIDPDDWQRFGRAATRAMSNNGDLIEAATEALQVVAARPTAPPSDSSDGRPDVNVSSSADSSSRVIHRLEEQGRPSIALMVQRRQESLASA